MLVLASYPKFRPRIYLGRISFHNKKCIQDRYCESSDLFESYTALFTSISSFNNNPLCVTLLKTNSLPFNRKYQQFLVIKKA